MIEEAPPRAAAKIAFAVTLLVLAAAPAFAAEMDTAAINSAEPSKKALSNEKPTPAGVGCRSCWTGRTSRRARSTASSERTPRRRCAPMRKRNNCRAPMTLTNDIWKKLAMDDRPVRRDLCHHRKDVAGPFLHKLPSKMEDMKDIPKLAYTSPREEACRKVSHERGATGGAEPGAALRSRGRYHRRRRHRRRKTSTARRPTGSRSTRSAKP